MSASLSDLADNLSAIFINKVSKKCMEKKINAECKFDGLEDDEVTNAENAEKNGMIQKMD